MWGKGYRPETREHTNHYWIGIGNDVLFCGVCKYVKIGGIIYPPDYIKERKKYE